MRSITATLLFIRHRRGRPSSWASVRDVTRAARIACSACGGCWSPGCLNDYGKTAEERALILSHVAEVEPLLRATCTHEIDATQPLDDVVAQLVEIARGE